MSRSHIGGSAVGEPIAAGRWWSGLPGREGLLDNALMRAPFRADLRPEDGREAHDPVNRRRPTDLHTTRCWRSNVPRRASCGP